MIGNRVLCGERFIISFSTYQRKLQFTDMFRLISSKTWFPHREREFSGDRAPSVLQVALSLSPTTARENKGRVDRNATLLVVKLATAELC